MVKSHRILYYWRMTVFVEKVRLGTSVSQQTEKMCRYCKGVMFIFIGKLEKGSRGKCSKHANNGKT